MTKYLKLLFVSLILVSCSDNSTKSVDKNLTSADSLKQVFLPIINGVWALTDYVKDVQKTKSPFKSWDKLGGIDFFQINSVAEYDTLFIPSSLNNHEGFSFTLHFKQGQKPHTLKTDIPDYDNKENFFELGYEITSHDTSIFLYHFDKTNKLLSKKQYSRIRDDVPENDNAFGLQYFVNHTLISGAYSFADSSSSRTVEFMSDGSVKGFSNYKTYLIQTDFMVRVENNIDNLYLYRDERDSDCLAYKISGDTLKIFELVLMDSIGVDLGFGKIKYKLVRQ